MCHKENLLFYFEKGSKRRPKFRISHISKVYRIFIFHPIVMVFVVVVE
jgi:hypothetical protein